MDIIFGPDQRNLYAIKIFKLIKDGRILYGY